MLDCFFWTPNTPPSQTTISAQSLEAEHEAERLWPVSGFVPTMMAGLRLLVDPSPLAFPEPRPNHWPPPGPPARVRALLETAHAACRAGDEAPFAELVAEVTQSPELAEQLADALMLPAEYEAEFWDLWEIPPAMLSAAVEAPRAALVRRWIAYPPAVWLRGSADLSRERPSLEDVLQTMAVVRGRPAPHGVILGWALESRGRGSFRPAESGGRASPGRVACGPMARQTHPLSFSLPTEVALSAAGALAVGNGGFGGAEVFFPSEARTTAAVPPGEGTCHVALTDDGIVWCAKSESRGDIAYHLDLRSSVRTEVPLDRVRGVAPLGAAGWVFGCRAGA